MHEWFNVSIYPENESKKIIVIGDGKKSTQKLCNYYWKKMLSLHWILSTVFVYVLYLRPSQRQHNTLCLNYFRKLHAAIVISPEQ